MRTTSPQTWRARPFSNITDRNGNVIPGAGSHGIFPYARTSHFEINGGYSYVRPGIRFPARSRPRQAVIRGSCGCGFRQTAYGWECGKCRDP